MSSYALDRVNSRKVFDLSKPLYVHSPRQSCFVKGKRKNPIQWTNIDASLFIDGNPYAFSRYGIPKGTTYRGICEVFYMSEPGDALIVQEDKSGRYLAIWDDMIMGSIYYTCKRKRNNAVREGTEHIEVAVFEYPLRINRNCELSPVEDWLDYYFQKEQDIKNSRNAVYDKVYTIASRA